MVRPHRGVPSRDGLRPAAVGAAGKRGAAAVPRLPSQPRLRMLGDFNISSHPACPARGADLLVLRRIMPPRFREKSRLLSAVIPAPSVGGKFPPTCEEAPTGDRSPVGCCWITHHQQTPTLQLRI